PFDAITKFFEGAFTSKPYPQTQAAAVQQSQPPPQSAVATPLQANDDIAAPQPRRPETSMEVSSMQNETSPQTVAYILNVLFPGAGNIYFGQPIIGAVF